jgi:hypothetical protein
MPLILPDFKDRKCIEIGYCGHSAAESPEAGPPFPALKPALLATYDTPSGPAYIYVRRTEPQGDPSEEKKHLHIDLATASRFRSPPKTNADLKQVEELLAPYYGRKLDVYLKGYFSVQKTDLPPFIRRGFAASIADSVQVRMVAATLDVRGAPIDTISWRLRGSSPAEIILEAHTQLEFDESYFNKGLHLLESSFRAFIVKESAGA